MANTHTHIHMYAHAHAHIHIHSGAVGSKLRVVRSHLDNLYSRRQFNCEVRTLHAKGLGDLSTSDVEVMVGHN